MMLQRNSVGRAFSTARPSRLLAVRCIDSANSQGANRRDVLTAGGLLLASPLIITPSSSAETKMQPVKSLGTFQRAAQRDAFVSRVTAVLNQYISADDAPLAMRLVLHDAGTYDSATGTGGFNGSIRFPEELSRPENQGLKPLVDKLAAAKMEIDEAGAKIGQQPISWADLELLAAKAAVQAQWRNIKVGRAATSTGGALIADAYGAEWKVTLGRVDATEPDPAGRIPSPNSDVATLKAWMAQLGAKLGPQSGGLFAPKPPFWEQPAFVIYTATADDPEAEEKRWAQNDVQFAGFKRKYDASRETLTRTDYEVDFITFFDRLTSKLGTKVDPLAYLVPEQISITRF